MCSFGQAAVCSGTRLYLDFMRSFGQAAVCSGTRLYLDAMSISGQAAVCSGARLCLSSVIELNALPPVGRSTPLDVTFRLRILHR